MNGDRKFGRRNDRFQVEEKDCTHAPVGIFRSTTDRPEHVDKERSFGRSEGRRDGRSFEGRREGGSFGRSSEGRRDGRSFEGRREGGSFGRSSEGRRDGRSFEGRREGGSFGHSSEGRREGGRGGRSFNRDGGRGHSDRGGHEKSHSAE